MIKQSNRDQDYFPIAVAKVGRKNGISCQDTDRKNDRKN